MDKREAPTPPEGWGGYELAAANAYAAATDFTKRAEYMLEIAQRFPANAGAHDADTRRKCRSMGADLSNAADAFRALAVAFERLAGNR